ncbi:hypothetical protein [Corynebacterium sp. UMB2355A]|uniref:hypothetical protein n=1 Tax=Corynebacterium sp. UMB2355A TaxID=3081222 RepID=UPI0029FF3323|nr:hypothetical protein [Corynebacterium sp. UMB2355A]WPJ91829.1 hypothetical protein R0V12_05825 [Corynebacterium sp. UMB2355A]
MTFVERFGVLAGGCAFVVRRCEVAAGRFELGFALDFFEEVFVVAVVDVVGFAPGVCGAVCDCSREEELPVPFCCGTTMPTIVKIMASSTPTAGPKCAIISTVTDLS